MTTSPTPVPSPRQLLRVTVLAAAAAGLILLAIVLPAEYGVDPLGTGRATGLHRPQAELTSAAPASAAAAAAKLSSTPLRESPTPFRTDQMSVVLASGEGVEVKAAMRQGERLVFSWNTSGGGVDVDMHGEVPGASNDDGYTSYAKGEGQTSGHGALEAPVTGNHGWFWQNLNDGPVTVTVTVSGFHDKLFRP